MVLIMQPSVLILLLSTAAFRSQRRHGSGGAWRWLEDGANGRGLTPQFSAQKEPFLWAPRVRVTFLPLEPKNPTKRWSLSKLSQKHDLNATFPFPALWKKQRVGPHLGCLRHLRLRLGTYIPLWSSPLEKVLMLFSDVQRKHLLCWLESKPRVSLLMKSGRWSQTFNPSVKTRTVSSV